ILPISHVVDILFFYRLFGSGFICFFFFFFFQAEDGIRDATVTGVQTCALPISHRTVCARFVDLCREMGLLTTASVAIDGSKFKRSEERRVGKSVDLGGRRIIKKKKNKKKKKEGVTESTKRHSRMKHGVDEGSRI